MSREIIEAVNTLEKEKGISGEGLLVALEDALLAAYKKTPDAVPFARVEIDRTKGTFQIHQFVGEELPMDAIVLKDEPDLDVPVAELAEGEEEDDIDFDIDWTKVPLQDVETVPVNPSDNFGRIAAQTAKQVILQRIREAERGIMYDEYIDRVGEMINGTVQSQERGVTVVELGRGAEAILPNSEGIPGERHDHGARIKAVILEVRSGTKGPQIVLSRGSDEMIRRLFELEVPEVGDGLVVIRGVAREPGYRSKIAVESNVQGVDPVGACVGPRGSRVRMVVSELRGEKIDIIPWNEEPARFIAKALSPARVKEVVVDDEARQATVIVPDDNLALAIGREGQNARLAAKLTGWRIDIRSADEYDANAPIDQGTDSEGNASDGSCQAILKTGKSCPNRSIEGSPYCALHQGYEPSDGPEELDEDEAVTETASDEAPETDVEVDAAEVNEEDEAPSETEPAATAEAETRAEGDD
ncbi:MAG: transcription termination/antitermination protein NusA [Thermoleophilia bacterium]|nr:transcription termination/antitermination protein NusA [Thermoleophilia bacterium]